VQRIWIDREAKMLHAMPNMDAVERRLTRLADSSAQGTRLREDIEARMKELISPPPTERTGTS
jgi:hypothetical protein